MSYLQCPRCRASFHEGVIYESPDACPRCGARFDDRSTRRARLRRALTGRARADTPDWEEITGQQYTRHVVTRIAVGEHGDRSAAA